MQIEDLLKPGQKSGRVMILSRPLTVDSNFLHLDALKVKCNFRLASIFFMRRPGACVIILMPSTWANALWPGQKA